MNGVKNPNQADLGGAAVPLAAATGGSICRRALASLLVAALLWLAGCGGGSQSSSPPQQGLAPPPPPPQINSYFGTDGDIWSSSIDHSTDLITGKDITNNGLLLTGSAAGTFTSAGGFLDLSLTSVPPLLVDQKIGFALDIPSRAALLRLGDSSNPLIPLAPTDSCPTIGGTVTYQYVTIPNPAWTEMTDTAYGSVQANASDANWNFSNITQFTLTGTTPANPGSGLPTGFCGLGVVGYVITAPSTGTTPPLATVTIGLGPTGFLLEDNGSAQAQPPGVVPSNALGAGVGAIGLIRPSSPLDTGKVVGSQYLGFYYEPSAIANPEVTQLASFGCAGSDCPIPPPTGIIGGVFASDDPTKPAGQNITITLGAQDPMNNGLYPSATVSFSGVPFPAVAIAGMLDSKYALFIIAQDTLSSRPLAIYLFQQ